MKIAFSLVAAILIANLDFSFSKSVIVFDNAQANDEHNLFFQQLSVDEQEWIMKLAVWYHDMDKTILPIQGKNPRFGFGKIPFPSNETSPEVPDKLITHFLNGDVPANWQKQFTQWLKTAFNLNEKNFDQFKETGIFCYREDPCELIDLTNIGGICCPFG